jgi:mannose-6-phosphate isomerase-like protein (cupin superfamily)
MLRFFSNTAIIHSSQRVAGFGLIEMRGSAGTQTPLHVHHDESEGFFVLDGALRLHIGDRTVHLRKGQSTLAESGVSHRVVVDSGNPARWLVITNGEFDQFVATVADTDDGHPRPTDDRLLKEVAAGFGIDIIDSTSSRDHHGKPRERPLSPDRWTPVPRTIGRKSHRP